MTTAKIAIQARSASKSLRATSAAAERSKITPVRALYGVKQKNTIPIRLIDERGEAQDIIAMVHGMFNEHGAKIDLIDTFNKIYSENHIALGGVDTCSYKLLLIIAEVLQLKYSKKLDNTGEEEAKEWHEGNGDELVCPKRSKRPVEEMLAAEVAASRRKLN